VVGPICESGDFLARDRELPGVETFEANAAVAEPPRAPGTVLLDMPCSGLGVLSRRPDTKWKRRPADLGDLTLLQREILDNALAQVRPGGRIEVITCTLNPEENQGLVNRFAQDNDRVAVEREWTTPSYSPLNEFFYAASLTVK